MPLSLPDVAVMVAEFFQEMLQALQGAPGLSGEELLEIRNLEPRKGCQDGERKG